MRQRHKDPTPRGVILTFDCACCHAHAASALAKARIPHYADGLRIAVLARDEREALAACRRPHHADGEASLRDNSILRNLEDANGIATEG